MKFCVRLNFEYNSKNKEGYFYGTIKNIEVRFVILP